jgi:hypothetical protein
MTSHPPRPDPIVPAGSPRRSARFCRMNPATSIGSANPSNRLGCGTRTPMSTLPPITYVVQGRSNTVGVLSIGAGVHGLHVGGRSLPRFAS